jgi:hypothetical protein
MCRRSRDHELEARLEQAAEAGAIVSNYIHPRPPSASTIACSLFRAWLDNIIPTGQPR